MTNAFPKNKKGEDVEVEYLGSALLNDEGPHEALRRKREKNMAF